MANTTVTRSRMVLEQGEMRPNDTDVWFGSRNDDTGFLDNPTVFLSVEKWRELGEPKALTVALWPGDRQDLMEADDFPE